MPGLYTWEWKQPVNDPRNYMQSGIYSCFDVLAQGGFVVGKRTLKTHLKNNMETDVKKNWK